MKAKLLVKLLITLQRLNILTKEQYQIMAIPLLYEVLQGREEKSGKK